MVPTAPHCRAQAELEKATKDAPAVIGSTKIAVPKELDDALKQATPSHRYTDYRYTVTQLHRLPKRRYTADALK